MKRTSSQIVMKINVGLFILTSRLLYLSHISFTMQGFNFNSIKDSGRFLMCESSMHYMIVMSFFSN